MNQQLARDLKFLVLFSIVFTASSFLFSFLSWGRAALGPPEISEQVLSNLIELAEHAAFGVLAALPTRRAVTILTGAICAVSIDVDHLGSIVGLPTDGRASHTLLFAVLILVLIYSLTRKGILGQSTSPLVASSVALAAVVSHLALDATVGGGDFPLWMPFSNELVSFSVFGGVLLELIAGVLVWAAVTISLRRNQGTRKQV
jgi:hypothetical protein